LTGSLKRNQAPTIEAKSIRQLKKYFEEIVPDYSKDKVYVSDIRKVFLWYNILQKKDLLIKEEPESTTETAAEGSVPEIPTGKGKAESANTGKKE
jgi:hypothetical protein